MTARKSLFKIETAAGPSLIVGDTTITPQSRAVVMRLPFGGFVWNRPVAVLVEREGREERMPIRDVTRMAQIGMGLYLAAMAMAARRTNRKETER